jgi:hypothetical protein
LLVQSIPGATRAAIDSARAKKNVRYSVAAEVNAPWSLIAGIHAGFGAGILPWVSGQLLKNHPNLLVFPLVNPVVQSELVIVLKPGSTRSRASSLLKKLAFDTLKSLYSPLVKDIAPGID